MKFYVGTISKTSYGKGNHEYFNLYDCTPETNIPIEDLIDLFNNGVIYTNSCYPADDIEKVIYHDPATIVKWKDGTKTIVECQKDKGDTYNPEQGLAMCIVKKICGNKGNYNNIFTKWLPKENNNEETI